MKKRAAKKGSTRTVGARKRTPAKSGSGKRSPGRPSRPAKRTAPVSKASRTMRARDEAVEQLGRKVRPGKVKLGSTRQLTPTKAGFRALKREIESVQRTITRRGAKPRAYSFQLSIRYRGADGRFKKLERVEGVFPLKRSLSKRKKKGESAARAFERITETRIKAAVFRAIDRAEGIVGYTPAVERALASGDRDRITRAMRAFKKRRGVTFKVDVERHVTTGEAERERRHMAAGKKRKSSSRRAAPKRKRG